VKCFTPRGLRAEIREAGLEEAGPWKAGHAALRAAGRSRHVPVPRVASRQR
jgi:hypothetical protein